MGDPAVEKGVVRMTWSRRIREDAGEEFASIASAIRYSRAVRWWRRRVVWPVEAALLAWTEAAEPSTTPDLRLLAENEDGDWLVPHGLRDGVPWWEGYWRWWRPDHWPAYIRSRWTRTYVVVERWP